MVYNPREEDPFLLSISDLWRLCKKERRSIRRWTSFGAFLACVLTLLWPVQYTAESSYKDKSSKNSGKSGDSFVALIADMAPKSKGEAVSTFFSQRLLEEVARRTNMQATLKKKRFFQNLDIIEGGLRRVFTNLRVACRPLHKATGFPLADLHFFLKVDKVDYREEMPLNLEIACLDEQTYKVINSKGQVVGKGRFGEPFWGSCFSFVLSRATQEPLTSKTFLLNLKSPVVAAKDLKKRLSIKVDKKDKELLILTYKDRDRHRASFVLNTLMAVYEDYLKEEQQRISDEQMAFLHERETRAADKFKNMVESYASKQASELSTLGFPTVEKAMEFFANQQLALAQKQIAIELDLQRCEGLGKEGLEMGSLLAKEQEARDFLQRIRELKQRKDALELAIHAKGMNAKDAKEAILRQFSDIAEAENCIAEAKDLYEGLKQGKSLKEPISLIQHSHYLVGAWWEKYREAERAYEEASQEDKEKKQFEKESTRAHFMAYLTSLVHYFDVYQRMTNERLLRQESSQSEFQGIPLSTANDLYLSYSKELSENDAKILQHKHILGQLKIPSFEISTLSPVLEDPVSLDIVKKASVLTVALNDANNYSEKERERTKNELALQKQFIQHHIEQTLELLQLQKNLLHEKLEALQKAMLGLVNEQISILEKQLADYFDKYHSQLKSEQNLLQEQQSRLKQEMAQLPMKWAAEKLFELGVKRDERMLDEVSRLMEVKNISNNLEIVQSTPLDKAIPPLAPRKPYLLVFAFLGAFAGACLSVIRLTLKSAWAGVEASFENIELSGGKVLGTLPHRGVVVSLANCNSKILSTLRRIIAFVDEKPKKAKALLLVQGQGCDYSKALATLLSKGEGRVLYLSLFFDRETPPSLLPGLLQYGEGEVDAPKIIQGKDFDEIAAGGVSPFVLEILAKKDFAGLLERLKEEYDWIIAPISVGPKSTEIIRLLSLFDCTILNICGEKLDELKIYLDTNLSKQIAFVMTEINS